MKTTEELEEIYDSEPYEWIALWENRGVWVKITNPSFIHGCHYKLVHIKHKEVLEAYLADDKVEIKFYLPYVMCTDDTELEATWEVDDNFIENYNPDLEYRLKEKKDGTYTNDTISSCTFRDDGSDSNTVNNSIPTIKVDEDLDKQVDAYFKRRNDEDNRLSSNINTTMDNSVDSDNVESELDTFTAHGFEVPSFDGEIWKEVDNEVGTRILGRVYDEPTYWYKDGTCGNDNRDYNLTPIKKHWSNDPANFPVRLVRDTEQYVTYRWVYKREDFIKAHRQGFKLVTED